jgi:uncharacterized protein
VASRAPLAIAFVSALFGCSAGSAGSAVRPVDKRASDALGEVACRDVARGGEPLIVDLAAHERANFEDAMQTGIALVHYDCERLELSRGCSAEGTYAFQGLSPREFAVKLEDGDEVRANLPSLGAVLVGKISSELERGATIDLAVSMIGKRKTTVSFIPKAGLTGSCDDVTHFVRGVHVGAFAMTTGSRGHVRAAAEIFGAGVDAKSTSTKIGSSRDGDLEACRKYSPSQTSPPETCRSLVRLELWPLMSSTQTTTSGAKEAALTETGEVCPEGLVRVEEHCQRPSDQPFACRHDKPVECEEQCEKGSGESCVALGLLYTKGAGVPADPARAIELFRAGCDRGTLNGCVNQGASIEAMKDADLPRADRVRPRV